MDLTELDDLDTLGLGPERELQIENIAALRFDGDVTEALRHVYEHGVQRTPEADRPASPEAAGPVIETGLEYTARFARRIHDTIYGDADMLPEPFVIDVSESGGPPITFGRHFTPQRFESDGYYELLDEAETQTLDHSALIDAMSAIRKLIAVDDTACQYAIRQNGFNATGTGLFGFTTALPGAHGHAERRRSWQWDTVQDPEEPARVAVVIRFDSHWLVVGGQYLGDSDMLRIESVVAPIVHDTKGGTDVCQAICEQFLPDVDGLDERIQQIGSRPSAETSSRFTLTARSCSALPDPITDVRNKQRADPGQPRAPEFIDRVLVANPFGARGHADPDDIDVPSALDDVVTAPQEWVLHLRDHAMNSEIESYAFTCQDVGVRRIGGVANVTAMGTYLEPSQYDAPAQRQ